MTIALARDVEEFLQRQVQTGVCADAGELVNDVVRFLRDQQGTPFEVTPELEKWLLDSADGPTTPFGHADIEGIRERVRQRWLASEA